MPDDLPTVDARLDAALQAMREPTGLTRHDSAHVAARAVLAGAPRTAGRRRWLRAAAAVVIAFAGVAVLQSARDRERAPSLAGLPTPGAERVVITPVAATNARPIVFELDAPDAHTVQVLGDFNQWSRNASAMQRGADGRWRVTTLLLPGRYVYTFLVDGQTFRRDPMRDAIEDRDFGVNGSELVVGEAP